MTAQDLKPLITKVQTLRRQVTALGEDDTWRDFLSRCTGVRSTRAMNKAQLSAVVEALHRAGALRTLPKSVGRPRHAGTAQMAMIRGLWLELADLGAVQDRSEAAIAAFVKRQTRQDIGRLPPNAAASVIEALKGWRARITPRPEEPAS